MDGVSNIQRLRKAATLTQQAVALALGIDRSTVAQWEIGVALPRADKLPLLAKLYGCQIDDLLNRADEREVNANAQSAASRF